MCQKQELPAAPFKSGALPRNTGEIFPSGCGRSNSSRRRPRHPHPVPKWSVESAVCKGASSTARFFPLSELCSSPPSAPPKSRVSRLRAHRLGASCQWLRGCLSKPRAARRPRAAAAPPLLGPSRHPATTPRARAPARALGLRPLGRARAPALPRTPKRRSPGGPSSFPRAPLSPGTLNCQASSPTSLLPRECDNFLPFTHTQGCVRTCPFGVRVGELPKLETKKSHSWAFEHAQLWQPRKGFRPVNPRPASWETWSWGGDRAVAKAQVGTMGDRKVWGGQKVNFLPFLSPSLLAASIHSQILFHNQRTF